MGDIACLPKKVSGWLYLASWQDACSRKIVGWDVRESMPKDLVSEVQRRTLVMRQPSAGLIAHSNQGSRTSAPARVRGTVQRTSRCGNC